MYSRRNHRDAKTGKPAPRPINVKIISVTQNLFMTIYSLWALIGTSLVLYQEWKKAGFSLTVPFCDPQHRFQKAMDFWFYTFYLSKFLEFVDTVLLILRAKPVMPPGNSQYFLHGAIVCMPMGP